MINQNYEIDVCEDFYNETIKILCTCPNVKYFYDQISCKYNNDDYIVKNFIINIINIVIKSTITYIKLTNQTTMLYDTKQIPIRFGPMLQKMGESFTYSPNKIEMYKSIINDICKHTHSQITKK